MQQVQIFVATLAVFVVAFLVACGLIALAEAALH